MPDRGTRWEPSWWKGPWNKRPPQPGDDKSIPGTEPEYWPRCSTCGRSHDPYEHETDNLEDE